MAAQAKWPGRPQGSGGKAQEFTPDQVQRIDKCLNGTRHELRNRALFHLGLGSGMRVGELVGLRVLHLAANGNIQSGLVLEKHSTKSRRSRAVAISRQAVQHLRAYLASRGLKSKTAPLDPNAPLFPSQQRPHQPMTTTNAILLLGRMFRRAGVDNASSHSLRRTHANSLRRRGIDLKLIQQQLGHSTLAVTERYFDVDPLEQQRAIEQLRF